jgi:hypothetical protein
VGAINDPRIKDEELVLAIGKASEIGLTGLKGLTGNDLYRDIVMNDIHFSSDEILKYAFPSLIKQYHKLPLNKYLSRAVDRYEQYEIEAQHESFDTIISSTIRNNRHSVSIPGRSVESIWNSHSDSREKRLRLIAHLEQHEINISALENILKELFMENAAILEDVNTNSIEKSNLRRLIRVYDLLKYRNNEKSPDQSK